MSAKDPLDRAADVTQDGHPRQPLSLRRLCRPQRARRLSRKFATSLLLFSGAGIDRNENLDEGRTSLTNYGRHRLWSEYQRGSQRAEEGKRKWKSPRRNFSEMYSYTRLAGSHTHSTHTHTHTRTHVRKDTHTLTQRRVAETQ